MWSYIKNFREFVWPLLDTLEVKTPRKIIEADCKWNEDETDIMLEYAEKYQESEEDRKKAVESKSTIFIGAFGVAVSVLLRLIKDMVSNNSEQLTPVKLVLICLMTLSIIYLCRAIWFAIKTLERQKYHNIGFPDFMLSDCAEKKKLLIIEHYNNINRNHDVINIKVDYMTMAQEYFKRAIVSVALFSVIVVSNYMLANITIINNILIAFDLLSINQITLIGLFGGLTILFIAVVILSYKMKKLEKFNTRGL